MFLPKNSLTSFAEPLRANLDRVGPSFDIFSKGWRLKGRETRRQEQSCSAVNKLQTKEARAHAHANFKLCTVPLHT
jgi:hypothetical protein